MGDERGLIVGPPWWVLTVAVCSVVYALAADAPLAAGLSLAGIVAATVVRTERS